MTQEPDYPTTADVGQTVNVTGAVMLRVGNYEVVEVRRPGIPIEIVANRWDDKYGWLFEGKPAEGADVVKFNLSVATKGKHRHEDCFVWGDHSKAAHGHLFFSEHDFEPVAISFDTEESPSYP